VYRALFILILACPAFAQTVTASATVRVDGKPQRPQINGRWWSGDNRQMFPPRILMALPACGSSTTNPKFDFQSSPSFKLALAESLHLFDGAEAVGASLGEPKTGYDRPGGYPVFYRYYAADGMEVSVRFMQNHLLGEAKYGRIGGPLGGDGRLSRAGSGWT
jgi:hypothetical protein